RPTLRVVHKGKVDIVGVIYAIGVINIDDVGSSWETTGGKVEEGNSTLVVADAEVGTRVGGMYTGMAYTSFPDEPW
ncbi:hypothetical protein KI387_022475, partial [Taxus chinensis]